MTEFDEIDTKWIKPLDDKILADANFQKILSFYLFHTPVNSLSAQSKDLQSYGWPKPWNKKFKLNTQLKEVSSNEKLIYSANRYDVMADALSKADLLTDFPNNIETERISVLVSYQTQFVSIFAHLRNSLAHARFCIKEVNVNGQQIRVYVFQDRGKKQKISARMIIRESTLLKWIEIISGGEAEYLPKEKSKKGVNK
ncbi:MAG: hypothetical protein SPJ89_09915 [Treponema sp.]|nr:hypothetical protein [Spirochaetia bacterium]MDD7460756.1 hypothetical protein [Spirochaetales bacterium]MDY5812281.1 hypothetical protein [Treponema sp.]